MKLAQHNDCVTQQGNVEKSNTITFKSAFALFRAVNSSSNISGSIPWIISKLYGNLVRKIIFTAKCVCFENTLKNQLSFIRIEIMHSLTFCNSGLTNISPDGVLLKCSGGRFSLRASSGVTFKRMYKVERLPPNLLGIISQHERKSTFYKPKICKRRHHQSAIT